MELHSRSLVVSFSTLHFFLGSRFFEPGVSLQMAGMLSWQVILGAEAVLCDLAQSQLTETSQALTGEKKNQYL